MKVWGKRFLLNLPGVQSTAAIVAEVEDSSGWKPGTDGQGRPFDLVDLWTLAPNVMLKVSDCDRSVNFAIGWQTAHERRAALVKVDRLIEALEAFREGLAVEQVLYVERTRLVKRSAARAAVSVVKA